jgi:toxin ParE1/3/4
MIVEFLSQAKSELTDAVEYYEGELNGLGQRFWDEVDQHIAWIARNHEVPRLRPGGYRRINLKIFPYYISYVVRDPMIWILAIAHGHSRPEYWIDRPKTID